MKTTLRASATAVLTSFAFVMAGCGSDDSGDAPAPARTATAPGKAADSRLAARALLTLGDLPSGWTEADDEEGSSKCAGVASARRTLSARAVAGPFSKDDSYISHYLYVFDDEPRARDAFQELTAASELHCLGEQFKQALVDEGGYSVGAVSADAVAAEPLGSESAAGRIVVAYRAEDDDEEFETNVDVVFVRERRAIALLYFLEDFSGTFGEGLRSRISSLAARRLRDRLQTT